ncbi:leucine-rich repeat domain-containing protein [Haliscomenobacter sp.]|uniref:leucine-rich repeat domain-containing protein n=1 Tax=Haliscomenobacter sp. TaxID=2717303 RepID=UPI003BAC908B
MLRILSLILLLVHCALVWGQKPAIKAAPVEKSIIPDSALIRANKILDNLYFYKDSFALVNTFGGFMFITKQGEKLNYRAYSEATRFDDDGFAKGKHEGNYYLIDTKGREYLLANELAQLNEKTEALDLRGKLKDSIPLKITNYPKLKFLFLSFNKIKTLPKEIQKLKNLQYLDLSGNDLSTIPPELGELKALQKLGLKDNKLSTLPAEIGNLSGLLLLNLSYNKFKTFPEALGNLEQLRHLTLYSNAFDSLSAAVGGLKNLEVLNLNSNRSLQKLPPEIGQLSKLKSLDLESTFLRRLPSEIGNLSELENLNVASTQISSLPPEMGKLQNLKRLNAQWCRLESIPKELGQLKNLRQLILRINPIQAIPPELGQLSNLENLDLHYTRISNVPPELGKLSNLQYLFLSWNSLTNLPAELGQLKKLKEIELYHNNLSIIALKFSALPELNKLKLGANSKLNLDQLFTDLAKSPKGLALRASSQVAPDKGLLQVTLDSVSQIPASLGKMKNLNHLSLPKFGIKALPPEIGLLSNLKVLDLSENKIESLPSSIGNLQSLEELRIGDNKLTSLPVELGKLTNLKVLVIYRNQLTKLPIELNRLTALTNIYIEGNQWNTAELKKLNPKITANYFMKLGVAKYDEENFLESFEFFQLAADYFDHIERLHASSYCSNLAWQFLMVKDFKRSLEAALLGLKLDPQDANLYTNLPLAYLFNNEFEKARAIYVNYRDRPYEDTTYKQVFLKDFSDLEASGVSHPDFQKIRNLLNSN